MAKKTSVPSVESSVESPVPATPWKKLTAKERKAKKKAETREVILKLWRDGVITGVEAQRQAEFAGVELGREFTGSERGAIREGPKPYDLSYGEVRSSLLDGKEKEQIYSMMKEGGLNRSAALLRCGFDPRRFRRSLREDREFAERILLIEASKVGECESVILARALNGEGDVDAAYKFISLRATADATIRKFRLMDREVKIKERLAAASLGEIEKAPPLNFKSFSDNDIKDYESLFGRVTRGEILDSSEYERLGRYQALLYQSLPSLPQLETAAQAVSTPSSVTEIEAKFEGM